jgi:hypothetical protein
MYSAMAEVVEVLVAAGIVVLVVVCRIGYFDD